jgi:uncharacterized protein YuzE
MKADVKQYDDGILIEFEGEPYDVVSREANVEIYYDRKGRIIAIDIVYKD